MWDLTDAPNPRLATTVSPGHGTVYMVRFAADGRTLAASSDDGTITMYGHMASSGVLVQKGQRVTAGDVIGLVGNEGFSTGPHVHFEVWKNGTTKIDPAPWLAEHGVRMSAYTG